MSRSASRTSSLSSVPKASTNLSATCDRWTGSARWLDATLDGEAVDVGGVEAYVLADLVERDAAFVDEAAHEPDGDAEAFGCLVVVDERRARCGPMGVLLVMRLARSLGGRRAIGASR